MKYTQRSIDDLDFDVWETMTGKTAVKVSP